MTLKDFEEKIATLSKSEVKDLLQENLHIISEKVTTKDKLIKLVEVIEARFQLTDKQVNKLTNRLKNRILKIKFNIRNVDILSPSEKVSCLADENLEYGEE